MSAPRAMPETAAGVDLSEGPLAAYRALMRTGELRADPAQELAAEKLQSLHHALKGYEPAAAAGGGWKARLGLARRAEAPPQGLYLYGAVGTGKSMLMDLFVRSAPVAAKRRVHFHAFMAEVHERLHAWRRATKGARADPLPQLAGDLAAEAWLLCFDEFHVVNVADAMILGRLFEALLGRGAVLVATSNTAPDRLYEGGLQRARFLPFIRLLKERLDVLELDGGVDYRHGRGLAGREVYLSPLGPEATAALDAAFAELAGGAAAQPTSLAVKGRRLQVPAAARGVARFGFEELCARALGAGDYLALAVHFHTLVLDGVPRMGPEMRNEARRFMHLVDALYEHRCNLVVAADGPPEALYPTGDGAAEFARTASRLAEMRSRAYLEAPHLT